MDAGAVVIAVFAAAYAQEAPPEVAPEVDAPREEIVVYGRLAVQQARDAIVHQLEDLGYRVRSHKDGRTIFAPPSPWMGGAVLEQDGTITFRSPPVGTPVPDEAWAIDPRYEDPTAGQIRSYEIRPSVGIGAGIAIPSKRKRETVRAQVLEATADEVEVYRTLVRHTQEQVAAEQQ